MNYLTSAYSHFKTITNHKIMVMEGCFYVGLYWQGIMHDLSKYMPDEFLVGVKYFQGTRSPNNAEREDIGYSSAWLHHKGRNKHHYEYWMDYSSDDGKGIIPANMPDRYIVEMFIDRVAASKNYNKENYRDDFPLQYYKKGMAADFMHPETRKKLEFLLNKLARDGEEATFNYVRDVIVKKYIKRHKSWHIVKKRLAEKRYTDI